MAKKAHLDILQQGVEPWNSWREWNPSIAPDLSGAKLQGADLSSTNLTEADLTYSVFVKTDLTGATLTGCRIYGISAWNLNLERLS
jgi:uncharacterized protein YjbI with pentapeptide repeats